MNIITTDHGFRVQGEVSFENVVGARLQGEKLLVRNMMSCVIDLSEMKDQDASPVSLLLCWQRLANKNKIKLSFLHVSSSMQRMRILFGLN